MKNILFLLAIALSAGVSAANIPDGGYAVLDLSSADVSARAAAPAGGWSLTDRTDRLILRKLEPGAFESNGRKVSLTHPFLIGVFPVTQRQYERVMGKNPSRWRGDARPVESVSWDELNAPDGFLARLRKRTGWVFDLPTEAEWEYACRAGTATHFSGGETKADLRRLGRFCENRDDGRGGFAEHTTVGAYETNAWGLYDLHGNVWEWCRDWYGPFEPDALIDPTGARAGTSRVVRGGHWNDDWYYCGSDYRDDVFPDERHDCLGFRVVVRFPSEKPLDGTPLACRRWAEDRTVARRFVSSAGTCLGYRLHEPTGLAPGRRVPLVVFLHGAGERGGDNVRQLVHGVPQLLNFAERNGEPCFLVAAQVPRAPLDGDAQGLKWVSVPWDAEAHRMPQEPSWPMAALAELVDALRHHPSVDTNRVYVTGISMGGFGTWDLAMRHPDWFAAAMPICGGADTNEAARLRDMPVRLFHGDADTTVLPVRSRTMFAALKAIGSDVGYREYPGVGHDCWTATYADDDVLKWLFGQERKSGKVGGERSINRLIEYSNNRMNPTNLINLQPATPESQGVSSQAILDWIGACEKKFDAGKAGALHGFVLMRHGKVIAEGSWKPFDTLNEPHMLWSHSKSFTSSSIGFLVDDGKLDLDERVADLFPDAVPANACENLRQMRVRDLLTMNHGEETGHTICNDGDWVRNFMRKDFTHKPGTRMWYDSDATYMLSAIVAKKSGMDAWAFLKARLLDKIGIEKARTTRSPQGIPTGGSGMYMTTRELARFGQFYLQRGNWNGEQLLSTEWVTLATARQTWCDGIHIQSQVLESGSDWRQGYGFQFWRCRHNAYRADGAAGQLSVIMPDQDAVLSVHAGLSDMQAELDLVWKHLLPAMKDGPLTEDAVLQGKLRERLDKLAIAPPAGTRTGAAANRLGGTFVFGENERNFKSIRFEPTASGWRCTLVTPSGRQTFPVGYGAWERGRAAFDTDLHSTIFNLPGEHATAASGAFDADGAFRVTVYLTDTTTHFDFTLPAGDAPLTCGGNLRATAEERVEKVERAGR